MAVTGGKGRNAERTLQRCHREGGAALQDRSVRHDGWTKERRATFLEVIGQTCNVSDAVRASGMSVASAYRLRQRDPVFREQWEEALEQAFTVLEMAVMQELLAGSTVVTRIRDGGEDGPVRETREVKKRNLTAAIQLLRAHQASAMARRAKMAAAHADGAAVTRDIMARIEQLRSGKGAGAKAAGSVGAGEAGAAGDG